MAEHIPVIAGAARTPTGRFLGNLASFTAPQLGAIAIKEAVHRSAVAPDSIDEVIMGNVVSAGIGQAPARQAAIGAGLPVDIPAFTINKVCGSGLKAVMLAAQAIRAGDEQVFVAGGMESMSNAPYLLPKARTGYRMGDGKIIDSVVHDGLWCAFEDIHMATRPRSLPRSFVSHVQSKISFHCKATSELQLPPMRAASKKRSFLLKLSRNRVSCWWIPTSLSAERLPWRHCRSSSQLSRRAARSLLAMLQLPLCPATSSRLPRAPSIACCSVLV